MWLLLVQNAASAMSIILGRSALEYSAPFFYIGSRMILAGLLLLFFCYSTLESMHIKRNDLFLLVQIMIFQLYLAYLCDIYAISQLTAAQASILYTLAPFIAALFSYFIFNEYMTMRKMVGMFIGFMGIVCMALVGSSMQETTSLCSLVGLILLFGVACNTYGYILMRILVKKRAYHPLLITAFAMFGAGLCTLVTSFFVESPLLLETNNKAHFAGILLSVVICGNIIAYGLNSFLLRRYTTTFISFAGFLYPLFAALFGWLFFAETVSTAFFITIFLVIVGLYIFYYEELRQGYYSEK